ncbi:MAG: hypothetical protein ACFCU6_05525 [Balneolaceae bacterium]
MMKKLIFFILLFAFSIISDSSDLAVGKLNISGMSVFAQSEIIADDNYLTCKGELRYCGGNEYKCIRVDDGLFDCCWRPEHCPIIEEN